MVSLSRFRVLFTILLALFVCCAGATENIFAQSEDSRPQLNRRTPTPTPTPTPEQIETVRTEEIKLNISAINSANGEFVSDVRVEDLVINEDGRLHQPTSVRRTPANVLILLDVGNEIAYAKRRRTTSSTAISLVRALLPADSVAVMQYGDKVEILSDWSRDKEAVMLALDEKKLGFGKRSVFNQALDAAVEFFMKTPRENRHLILISDGVDTFNDARAQEAAVRNLLSSDINVHVISYTLLQQNAITVPKTLSGGGNRAKVNLPPGAEAPVHGTTPTFSLGSINLDREMIRKRKAQIAQLKSSEQFLTNISRDTNGEIFLPETTDEMIEKTAQLAKNIDSQYVVTYTPKRPLNESNDGEVRVIEATSRRANLDVQGRRKLVIVNNKN